MNCPLIMSRLTFLEVLRIQNYCTINYEETLDDHYAQSALWLQCHYLG